MGFDEDGLWVVSLLYSGQEFFQCLVQRVRGNYECINSPLCLRNFFGKLFSTIFIASIEAVVIINERVRVLDCEPF